ncbi:hypothetical protein ABIE78_002484 [Sinorhizobium fredii]
MTRIRPALPMIFAVWTLMAGAAGAQDAPAATDNITRCPRRKWALLHRR